jgi:hypothetical protein
MSVKKNTLNPETEAVTTTPAAETNTAVATLDDNYFGALEAPSNDPNADASAAYVSFYNKKSGKAIKEAMEAAGGKEDQYYLVRNGACIPLQKFTYHLIESEKFFTEQDGAGKVVGVKDKDPGNDKYKEHALALIFVKLGNEIIPATFQARSSSYKALKAARQMWELAKDPIKFGANGEAYKVAATAKQFPARFYATASASMTKSSGTGQEYINANCSCSPSKIDDINTFLSAIQRPDFMQEFTKARGTYVNRVSNLRKMIK